MNLTLSLETRRVLRRLFSCLMLIVPLSFSSSAIAGILPVGDENDTWSDMAFPTGVSGSFGLGVLSISASPSNDLEIGPEFGPSNVGRHYGTGGTFGGPFGATLSLINVGINPLGVVTAPGSFTVTLTGSAAGSIGTDYGIPNGTVLLGGTVSEVLLDATGDNTLDILVSISGGALQTPNPNNGLKFALDGRAVLRISGVTMPSVWTGNFSLNGSKIDLFGLPEPSSLILAASLAMVSVLRRNRH